MSLADGQTARQGTAILVALGAAVLLYALFFAQLGFFIIDEAIYFFAADTFRLTGSLILDNGRHLGFSTDLLWTNLLTDGPDGVTSQYPPGTTFVWAPLLSVFGERSVIVLNALATVGTVFATRGLAMRLFGDPVVAIAAAILLLLGTFSLEYAFVYWPHMVSVWTIVLSFSLFLDAMDDRRGTVGPALLSGLILGAGMLFRLDNILLLPVFAVLSVLFAARPVRLMVGGCLGVVPAIAVLALVNREKFGTFNPVSYGGKSSFTSIEVLLPFAIAGMTVLLLLALFRARPPRRPLLLAAGGVAILAIVGLSVAPVRSLMETYAIGLHLLLIDARNPLNPLTGIISMPDGTTLYWGLAKKALAQSMPWLGLLGLLAGAGAWRGRGRAFAIVMIFAAIFTFPFVATAWHGGMSSNMRYFLPLLPFLAAVVARLAKDLVDRARGGLRPLLFAVPAGAIASYLWAFSAPTGLAGAHQIWSLYLFAAVAAVALLAARWPRPELAVAALVAGGLGLGTALFNTASDTVISQLRREGGRVLTDLSQSFPGKVLIYDVILRSALVNPDQVVALRSHGAEGPDEALVRAALADGYRVLMRDARAEAFVARHEGYLWRDVEGPVDMAEVMHPATRRHAAGEN